MTKEQEAEWARLAEEATEAPWQPCGASNGKCQCRTAWSASMDAAVAKALSEEDFDGEGLMVPFAEKNLAFICAARTAVPELLAKVARLREALRPFAEQGEKWLLPAEIRALTPPPPQASPDNFRRAARALAEESGDE